MMKRSKKLHITIDSLPSGLDHNDSSSSISSSTSNSSVVSDSFIPVSTRACPSAKSLANLVGIGSGLTTTMTNFGGFRRRKNFSLILLAGLSALLCALYYTSYYPGTVWALRLGVTSFNTTPNSQQQRRDSHSVASSSGSSWDGNSHNNNLKDGAAAGLDSQVELFPAFSVASSRGFRTVDDERSGRVNHHNNNDNGNNNAHQKTDVEAGVEAQNSDGISTPNPWDWKYWAELEYWKVNFTYDNNDEEEYEFSKKQADTVTRVKPIGVQAALSDFSTVPPPPPRPSSSSSSSSASGRTMVKVTDFQAGKKKKERRLACNFPRLKPFDPSITDYIKSPPAIDCAKKYKLVFRSNFRNKLILWGHPFPADNESSQGAANFSCCYKTITRGNGSDHNIIYSKRCYPILKVETEIPAEHEFISVRCRSIPVSYHHQTMGQKQKENEGPPESNKETNKDGNNGSNINNTSNSSNNNDNTSETATVVPTTTTKIYRDMLAFVPLKPMVEDRIRQYEESKRKSLYAQKKFGGGGNKSEKIQVLSSSSDRNSRKANNVVEGSEPEQPRRQGSLHEGEQLKQGINLSGERGRHDYKNESGTMSPFKTLLKENEKEGKSHAKLTLSNEDRLSVVLLGLDAQSHMNFIRQMPLTYNFLTKNLSAIGMYGYTKVGDNTFPNLVALLTGLSAEELEKVCWPTKQSYFDECPFIWKKFAENGYRTSFAEDSVWMGAFNYEKKGFLHPPTDYYLHPMSLLMAKKIGHENWANAKLCYGPRLSFEVLLDYIVKTAVTFTNSLYFQFVWGNSLFHDYLNNPRIGDELLAMTLEFMRNNGFLRNTAFILLSDHGIRWGSIRSTYQGKIEERMPLAYFAFPTWFRRKYPEAMRNLKRNMLRLTAPFDIYETLRDILRLGQGKMIRFDRWCDDDEDEGNCGGGSGNRSKSGSEGSESLNKDDEKLPRGISLFRTVPLQRTCKMAGIVEHWCVCHKMEKVPINSTLVESGAQFVLNIINGLVRKYGGLCAKLSLVKINEAKRKIDGDIDRGLDVDYFLTGAQAKGTPTTTTFFGSSNPSFRTAGDSDRISYGNAAVANNDYSITRKSDHDDRDPSKRKSDEIRRAQNSGDDDRTGNSERDNVIGSLSTSSDIKKMIQLQITFITQPGDAVFEATIYGEADNGMNIITPFENAAGDTVGETENDEENENMIFEGETGGMINHHWKLSGDISRLNLYGKQSACVTDYKVQKYCYCQNFKPE